jgi:tripartite-type tricarboxylate transporter receptor subunit TctC
MLLLSSSLARTCAGRPSIIAATLVALLFGLPTDFIRPASTQSRSGATVRLILPTTAGGTLDVMARLLADRLSVRTKQAVIVESMPGAGTTIAARAVAKAVPDGNTLLFSSTSHAVSAALYRKLDYDPIKDFAGVARVATGDWILVLSPTVPVNSIKELVGYSKANPGKLSIGFGAGTAPHLVVELFKQTTGADLLNVPYKGASQTLPDLLSSRLHLNFTGTAGIQPLIESGKLRVLASTGATRDPSLPAVPTMAESGYPELTLSFWLGILAPAKTPAAVVVKLNEDINESLDHPQTKALMDKLGFKVIKESPAEFARLISKEVVTWKKVADRAGLWLN